MITSKLDGRIRAQDDRLKETAFSKSLCAKLRKVKGIQRVQPTVLIGSLLVEYNTKHISTSEVLVFLSEHIDCTESPSSSSSRFSSWISDIDSARSGRKQKSDFDKQQSRGGRGRGQGRKAQSFMDTGGSSFPILKLMKNILPFTEGSSPLSNILKSLLSSAIGYQAYQFGRGRLGGGRGKK
jgi:hypothetical protein